MIVYVNERGEIKDVETTTDETLQEIQINDEENPFTGWSTAKICCYKVQVKDGQVVMLTPYVDSRMIEHIDQLGKQVESVTPYTETKTAYIGDTSTTFMTDREGNLTVYFPHEYTVERLSDRITVSYAELSEVTEITISII